MPSTHTCTCPNLPVEDSALVQGGPVCDASPTNAPCMVLIGWDVVDRATDTIEDHVALNSDMAGLRGYVETVERGYEDTRWELERVYRIDHP